MSFWKDRAGRERRRNEERIRQKALETIGRIKALGGGKPSESKQEASRSRSPARSGQGRRSYSRSSDSRSRSRSPSRRRGRDRSYSPSPPHRRRRSDSRSPPPRSSSPPRRWSPPPKHRGDGLQNVASQSHSYPQAGPAYDDRSTGPYPTNLTAQSPHLQYPQPGPSQHQNPVYPSSSGYYRAEMPSLSAQASSWNQGGQYPPLAAPRSWTQDPRSHNYGPNGSGSDYGTRGNDTQNRSWR